jgi:hypothetical protein
MQFPAPHHRLLPAAREARSKASHTPEVLSVAAGRRAVAWFWYAAQDITFSGQVPQPWISIGSQHPLFFVEGGSLRVRLPPDVAALI